MCGASILAPHPCPPIPNRLLLPPGAFSSEVDLAHVKKTRPNHQVPRSASTGVEADLGTWWFADTKGSLVDGLGVRSDTGVYHRYTFIVDPRIAIQHIYATNIDVERKSTGTLPVLDTLQPERLCPCGRDIGGSTSMAA